MASERLRCLRAIAFTAIITLVMTLAGVYAAFVGMMRQVPPTPQLAPPRTITVFIYPIGLVGREKYPPTVIPIEEFEHVLQLITPDHYYEQPNDFHNPIVAEVVITHDNQPDTVIIVRWTGKNPAAVTVDGRNYFYARKGPYGPMRYDGAMTLVELVDRLNMGKGP